MLTPTSSSLLDRTAPATPSSPPRAFALSSEVPAPSQDTVSLSSPCSPASPSLSAPSFQLSPSLSSPWLPFPEISAAPGPAAPEASTPPALLDPTIAAALQDSSTPLDLRHRVGLGLALALSLAGTVTLAGCSPPSTSQSATQATLPLVEASNPVLHAKARQVPQVDDTIRRTLADMENTMHRRGGVGLAAPQVGIPMRLIVVDAGGDPIKLVNPEIVSRSGDMRSTEGCLSLPGQRYTVQRSEKVVVQGLDEYGRPVTVEAKGLKARALQHEIDHLDGITIADRASQR